MKQLSAQVTQLLNKPFTRRWQHHLYTGLLLTAWVLLIGMFQAVLKTSSALPEADPPSGPMFIGGVVCIYLGIATLHHIEHLYEAYKTRTEARGDVTA